jgi:hypothetical protein
VHSSFHTAAQRHPWVMGMLMEGWVMGMPVEMAVAVAQE